LAAGELFFIFSFRYGCGVSGKFYNRRRRENFREICGIIAIYAGGIYEGFKKGFNLPNTGGLAADKKQKRSVVKSSLDEDDKQK
jgi:hypothetical protein